MAKARQNLVKRVTQMLAVQLAQEDTATRYAIARKRNALVKRMSAAARKLSGFSVVAESEIVSPE